MSLSKSWLASFLFMGLGLLILCPQASAQSNTDGTITDDTLPMSQWRQKVLHNGRTSPQMNKTSSQDVEYRTAQRTPYQKRVQPAGAAAVAYSQQASPRVAQREIPAEVENDPGATQYEPLAANGPFSPQEGCNSCGQCGGDCGDCGECGNGMEYCPWMFSWGPRNLAIFGGVHGYKGPRDRGVNGNFGFQEGVNFGAPLGDPWGCGYQVGFAALQSNISGYNTTTTTAATADRHQYFVTVGIFRRAECAGWQWGVVFDLLNDTYFESSDLKQIRTETGYLFNECFEVGYSGAYGVGGDNVNGTYFGRTIDGRLDATDQFVVYFRRYFDNGGDGRIWGGMTGFGDGLFGADAWIPLGGSWALQNSFNYLIPKGTRGSTIESGQLEGAQVRESWSVAFNLIWYPGRSSKCISKSCYRPLLNVADNSLFMVREATQQTDQQQPVPGAL